jgi:8-oxo-dGTP pyrophosphatase MutT (NUDIX family)
LKKVYKSKFVNVYLENFSFKKKKFKNFHKVFLNNSVMAIIINIDKQILLTKEYRRGVKKIVYGFPGGHINFNEKPLQAVKREIKEETGLTCKKLKKILTYVKDSTYFCGRDYLFYTHFNDRDYAKKLNKSKEIDSLLWVSINQFKRILKSPNNSSGFLACGYHFLRKKKF